MSNQVIIESGPLDAISSTKFSPQIGLQDGQQGSLLLATAWDGSARIYNPLAYDSSHGDSSFVWGTKTSSPLLNSSWLGNDGKEFCVAGLDGKVTLINLETGSTELLLKHDSAAKGLIYHEQSQSIISGGWDKTIRRSDLRKRSDNGDSISLPGKVFAMDASDNYLVVGLSGRQVLIYDMRKLDGQPLQRRESSLKYMTKDIKCMPNGQGYASSSIEGRVAIEFFDPSPASQASRYAFKCHRTHDQEHGVDIVYPVNSLAFHRNSETFFTGGSDGMVSLWHYKAKKRLKQYPRMQESVQTLDVNFDGSMLAVGLSPGAEEGKDCEQRGQIIVRYLNREETRRHPERY